MDRRVRQVLAVGVRMGDQNGCQRQAKYAQGRPTPQQLPSHGRPQPALAGQQQDAANHAKKHGSPDAGGRAQPEHDAGKKDGAATRIRGQER
jgi:hypothetical protein